MIKTYINKKIYDEIHHIANTAVIVFMCQVI